MGCFRCFHCKNTLTLTNFAMIDGTSYCKPHFKQLFQSSGGKYDRAFGSQFSNSSDPVVQERQRIASVVRDRSKSNTTPTSNQDNSINSFSDLRQRSKSSTLPPRNRSGEGVKSLRELRRLPRANANEEEESGGTFDGEPGMHHQ